MFMQEILGPGLIARKIRLNCNEMNHLSPFMFMNKVSNNIWGGFFFHQSIKFILPILYFFWNMFTNRTFMLLFVTTRT